MSRDVRMGPQGKEQAKRSIDHLIATGNTALYEAIDEAYQFLLARDPSRTRALIVLSDGKDIKPSPSLRNFSINLIGRTDQAAQSSSSQSCTAMMPTRRHCASSPSGRTENTTRGRQASQGSREGKTSTAFDKVFTDLANILSSRHARGRRRLHHAVIADPPQQVHDIFTNISVPGTPCLISRPAVLLPIVFRHGPIGTWSSPWSPSTTSRSGGVPRTPHCNLEHRAFLLLIVLRHGPIGTCRRPGLHHQSPAGKPSQQTFFL